MSNGSRKNKTNLDFRLIIRQLRFSLLTKQAEATVLHCCVFISRLLDSFLFCGGIISPRPPNLALQTIGRLGKGPRSFAGPRQRDPASLLRHRDGTNRAKIGPGLLQPGEAHVLGTKQKGAQIRCRLLQFGVLVAECQNHAAIPALQLPNAPAPAPVQIQHR